jgi:hypothetical protein
MGLESALLPGLGLVRAPGVGVHGGDHPVRSDLMGDAPPPVGPIGVLGRFHVLPGDECQQRVRISRLTVHRLPGARETGPPSWNPETAASDAC